jgi:hypothetical protein
LEIKLLQNNRAGRLLLEKRVLMLDSPSFKLNSEFNFLEPGEDLEVREDWRRFLAEFRQIIAKDPAAQLKSGSSLSKTLEKDYGLSPRLALAASVFIAQKAMIDLTKIKPGEVTISQDQNSRFKIAIANNPEIANIDLFPEFVYPEGGVEGDVSGSPPGGDVRMAEALDVEEVNAETDPAQLDLNIEQASASVANLEKRIESNKGYIDVLKANFESISNNYSGSDLIYQLAKLQAKFKFNDLDFTNIVLLIYKIELKKIVKEIRQKIEQETKRKLENFDFEDEDQKDLIASVFTDRIMLADLNPEKAKLCYEQLINKVDKLDGIFFDNIDKIEGDKIIRWLQFWQEDSFGQIIGYETYANFYCEQLDGFEDEINIRVRKYRDYNNSGKSEIQYNITLINNDKESHILINSDNTPDLYKLMNKMGITKSEISTIINGYIYSLKQIEQRYQAIEKELVHPSEIAATLEVVNGKLLVSVPNVAENEPNMEQLYTTSDHKLKLTLYPNNNLDELITQNTNGTFVVNNYLKTRSYVEIVIDVDQSLPKDTIKNYVTGEDYGIVVNLAGLANDYPEIASSN